MASKARQKVDRETMQLFDPEVDKPEHDEILTALFKDSDTLARLIAEALSLRSLTIITDETSVEVQPESDPFAPARKRQTVTGAEACKMAGAAPTWKSTVPVRVRRKEMEVLMNYSTTEGRTWRLIGFVDMAVQFDALSDARVTKTSAAAHEWVRPTRAGVAVLEVKSAWPTAGNLLRQLNLYRASHALGFGTQDRPLFLVVGPDDTVNELVCAHGCRLVTFERGDPWRFALVSAPRDAATAPT